MPKRSAGLLMVRQGVGGVEVLLVHPGGPFYAKKDAGVWSVPKGEYGEEEAPLKAAQREFQAEKMAIHAAMVDRMDREIGRVLGQLREMMALAARGHVLARQRQPSA